MKKIIILSMAMSWRTMQKILYLKTNVIPVRLVVATALMAISRKVIIFDFTKITPMYIVGTGFVVLALGVTYWLLSKKS